MKTNLSNLAPPDRLAIKLRPAAEKKVKSGHPWVFEKGIAKQNKTGKAGDIAIIFDQKKNHVLAVGLYDPDSVIRIKVLSSEKTVLNKEWFSEKIEKAYQRRIPLLQTATDSYRLIHGENDSFPGFIADIYAEVMVIKLYSAIWFPYLQWMIDALVAISSCSVVVLRLNRLLQNQPAKLFGYKDGQLLLGQLKQETVLFKEHGLQFGANVIKGHKTGYFLDHRHNRKRVGTLAKNKRVLDVFSYAGGFSVHAMVGGATEVTSLDISAKALAVAQQNMALNIAPSKHQILVGDAFKELEKLANNKKRFDLIVVDPPSFAKKESEINRALFQYAQLARLAVKLVTPGGVLVLASCSSRVSKEKFYETVLEAIKRVGVLYEEIERTEHDIDHPIGFEEGAYLKSIYLRISF